MRTGFSVSLDGKESTCGAGDLGSILGLGRSPGGGHGSPLQYSCLENPHGQRSLAGYSPLGAKESDTTERLSTHTHTAEGLLSAYTYPILIYICQILEKRKCRVLNKFRKPLVQCFPKIVSESVESLLKIQGSRFCSLSTEFESLALELKNLYF